MAIPQATHETSRDDVGQIVIDGEPVAIPARIYSPPIPEAAPLALSTRQRFLLACIYSRHHDGHVRETSVRQIIDADDSCVVPFLVQPLGEYVVEIVEFLHEHRAALGTAAVREFARANPRFLARTRQRAISYWDCYFRRRWINRADYPALQVLDFLDRRVKDEA
jgi:hypothetical protein